MTEDTKRALEIIQPIANEFNIKVSADDRVLYLNDIGIGISCNSTWATLNEFIGYLIVTRYNNRFRNIGLSTEQLDTIKAYWINSQLLKKLKGEEE